ncbi:MAG: acyltransferase family protein [Lachnospiraceae bacterium]|nr:acyltransferase family protein [Lachnospiraceae bacterium]
MNEWWKERKQMRKHYIDNLRNLTILLLFPVHTFMIWNDFGSKFYIWLGESRILSTLIVLVNPWFMPILFVIAGMSSRYSLERRSNKEFVVQRVHKLFIPFLAGTVFLVPFQTLYARRFFDAYDGGFVDNWKYFFTHLTDFSGYDGAFTPGHLWFILFLFFISLISLCIFQLVPYQNAASRVGKMPVWGILLLFIPIWLMYYLGNIGGFSVGKDMTLYLLGYYVLSNESVMETLEKSRKWLAVLWGTGSAALVILYYQCRYYGDLWINFVGWISILAVLVFGKNCLNRRTKLTDYLNRASYPIYILHQSILVGLAYYVIQICDVFALQVVLICIGSLVLTILTYHLVERIPVVRKMIGVK